MTQITLGVVPDQLYTIGEIAQLIKVDPKTVGRYAHGGRFGKEGEGWIRTLGGHRRIWGHAIIKALNQPYIPPVPPSHLKEEL